MKTSQFTLIAIAAIWAGCDTRISQPVLHKAVGCPFEKFKPLEKQVLVDPAKGGDFRFTGGTTLHIPADAFVDPQGNVIKTPVNVSCSQYHDAAEILSSGITMEYKTADGSVPFESAGMFELSANADGQKAEIAPGKKIDIDLASSTADEGYDFFKLNPASGQWEKVGTTAASENPTKQQLEDSIASTKQITEPELPSLPGKDDFVLDINVDYRQFPALKEYYGLAWAYNGEDEDEMRQQLNNKWNSTSLSWTGKSKDFSIKFYGTDKTIEVPVKPVLSAEQRVKYEAAFKKKMDEYNSYVAALTTRQQNYANEYEFTRKLSVQGMGIYNCDRVISYQKPVAMNCNLMLNGNPVNSLFPVYLISDDNSAVRQYGKSIKMDASRSNYFMVVMPDDHIAYISRNTIIDAMNSRGAEFDFDLTLFDSPVRSVDELKKIMETI